MKAINKDQALKILKVLIGATAIILGFEILFSIPAINDFFCSLIATDECGNQTSYEFEIEKSVNG